MGVEFPKVEYIIYNKQEKLNKEQVGWYKLLALRESVLNLSIKDFVGLDKDNSQEIYVSSFLDSIFFNIEKYLFDECEKPLLFDDFVYIASVATKALKAIIENPSTKLIKVEEQVKYNKITNSGIKTMQWLAKRPGSTITEKISPKNKVLTVSTKFSFDTKENEASMYLYDVLYRILGSRLFESKCKTCKNNSCNQKRSFEELLRLYSLNTAVKQSELSTIPKIRHSVQNNKLMCDKFYKVVWDCNVKISRIEKELKNEWDNLENILYKDMFYYIASIIKQLPNVKIKDVIGRIQVDKNGLLNFSNVNEFTFVNNEKKLEEVKISFDDNRIKIEKRGFTKKNSKFELENTSSGQVDLAVIHDDLFNYISKPKLVKEKEIIVAEEQKSLPQEEIVVHKYELDYKISRFKVSQKCLKFYKEAKIETVGDFISADKTSFWRYALFRKKYLDDIMALLREDKYDIQ